jgi:hypothetical protein
MHYPQAQSKEETLLGFRENIEKSYFARRKTQSSNVVPVLVSMENSYIIALYCIGISAQKLALLEQLL